MWGPQKSEPKALQSSMLGMLGGHDGWKNTAGVVAINIWLVGGVGRENEC